MLEIKFKEGCEKDLDTLEKYLKTHLGTDVFYQTTENQVIVSKDGKDYLGYIPRCYIMIVTDSSKKEHNVFVYSSISYILTQKLVCDSAKKYNFTEIYEVVNGIYTNIYYKDPHDECRYGKPELTGKFTTDVVVKRIIDEYKKGYHIGRFSVEYMEDQTEPEIEIRTIS
jgi:hypothetical protein